MSVWDGEAAAGKILGRLGNGGSEASETMRERGTHDCEMGEAESGPWMIDGEKRNGDERLER